MSETEPYYFISHHNSKAYSQHIFFLKNVGSQNNKTKSWQSISGYNNIERVKMAHVEKYENCTSQMKVFQLYNYHTK